MPEEAKTSVNVALAGSRKLYLLACVFYGIAAVSALGSFQPSASASTYHPIWHWTSWVDIGVEAWCIYFFVEMFTSMSNRMEEVICVLTIVWFALGIPEALHRLGYGWAEIPGGRWIDSALIIVAAFLVFLRTFQVFRRRKA